MICPVHFTGQMTHMAPEQALISLITLIMPQEISVTLKFVNGGDNAKDLHVKLDLGVGLSPWPSSLPPRPPPDPEQQAAGAEAVGTHWVAVRVLGSEVQLQPLGGVCVDLQ